MKGKTWIVTLSSEQRRELESFSRKHNAPDNLKTRAKIILSANAGIKYGDIAVEFGVQRKTISKWVRRWNETEDCAGKQVIDRLRDLPRPGRPDVITPEQKCKLQSLGCEKPELYNRPITHWTHKELADEAKKQGIVKDISGRHVGRLLKKMISAPIYSDTGSTKNRMRVKMKK